MQRVAELAKSAAVQKLGKLGLDAEHRRLRDAEHRRLRDAEHRTFSFSLGRRWPEGPGEASLFFNELPPAIACAAQRRQRCAADTGSCCNVQTAIRIPDQRRIMKNAASHPG